MIKFLKLYERFGIFLFILVGFVFLSFASPNFLKMDTILNVIAQGTYAAIVGYGMTLALTSGGFDLSVESVMALSSVLLAISIPKIGIPLAIVLALAAASFVGLLNGLIIAKLKVNPLITTLAMQTIVKGVALLLANGKMILSRKSSSWSWAPAGPSASPTRSTSWCCSSSSSTPSCTTPRLGGR